MPWCFRPHRLASGAMVQERHHTWGEWVLCATASSETLLLVLVASGVLCADEDGGLLYWRSAPWRRSPIRRYAIKGLGAKFRDGGA